MQSHTACIYSNIDGIKLIITSEGATNRISLWLYHYVYHFSQYGLMSISFVNVDLGWVWRCQYASAICDNHQSQFEFGEFVGGQWL